jgi:hypothetical protein
VVFDEDFLEEGAGGGGDRWVQGEGAEEAGDEEQAEAEASESEHEDEDNDPAEGAFFLGSG